MNDDRSVWSDNPIAEGRPDEYGRGPFVRTVASQIERATSADPSTVFALVGEWGSGKTSIIEQIERDLDDTWHIAWFTPWSAGDSAAMSAEFTSTLASALGVEPGGAGREKFARYAGLAAPLLNAVPLVGAAAAGGASAALELLAARPPWHQQFEELASLVSGIGVRVLIVVDDVDRLHGDELTSLLRIVRLLGRFRGVHYLLAYDESTVAEMLRASGAVGRSGSFMEKIVQYPFEIPPVSHAAALRRTGVIVREVLAETGLNLLDEIEQREAELIGIIAPTMRTPRNLERFRSQALTFADHVRTAELDVLDYLALTWLRLHAHGVWEMLPRWENELRSGTTPSQTAILESTKITRDEWLARIETTRPMRPSVQVLQVLGYMFEGVEASLFSAFTPHARGVSERGYLGRYLLLALPEDDVSDKLIEDAVRQLRDGSTSLRTRELAALIDAGSEASVVALNRAYAFRREEGGTSKELVDYVLDRVAKAGAGGVTSTAAVLRNWANREVTIALESRVLTVGDLRGRMADIELIFLAFRAKTLLQDGERGAAIERMVVDVLLEEFAAVRATIEAHPNGLGNLIALIARVRGDDHVRSMFSDEVDDYERYFSLAKSLVMFTEVLGGTRTWELAFNRNALEVAVTEAVRERHAPRAQAEVTGEHVPRDDLPSPWVTDAQRDEFVRGHLAAYIPGGDV
ncbi:P-loop NTPase fold protein [Microbacterium sp. NPDC091382]|uniref:P-loop NTPase fold protein n=1 Tax=Microbacterium sp. NPDC091382 TaxID=3364210 RepID=UPI0038096B20